MVMTVDYINRAIKSLARVVCYINDHLMVLLPLSPICILLTVCTRFFSPSHPFLHPFAKSLPPLFLQRSTCLLNGSLIYFFLHRPIKLWNSTLPVNQIPVSCLFCLSLWTVLWIYKMACVTALPCALRRRNTAEQSVHRQISQPVILWTLCSRCHCFLLFFFKISL